MVGLPGSGKSTWAQDKVFYSSNYKDKLYDCDSHINSKQYTNENIKDTLVYEGHYESAILYGYNDNHIYVDGLFLTQSVVETVVESTFAMISHATGCEKPNVINFIIEQWDCNREACLCNDNKRVNKGEREKNSKTVIENAPYDDFIDVDNLELHLGITLNSYPNLQKTIVHFYRNEHTVMNYSPNESFVYVNSSNHDGKMYSESWSLGGRWGNCWGGSGSLSSEKPKEFESLDKLLEKTCPNISFFQYKRMWSECVSLDEYTEHGYYGSYEDKARYVCDLEKLYNWLKENNLIEE